MISYRGSLIVNDQALPFAMYGIEHEDDNVFGVKCLVISDPVIKTMGLEIGAPIKVDIPCMPHYPDARVLNLDTVVGVLRIDLWAEPVGLKARLKSKFNRH